jgi:hypothetical protein
MYAVVLALEPDDWSRPVKARARRIACMVASVPETVRRAMSQKVSSVIGSQAWTSSSLVRLS